MKNLIALHLCACGGLLLTGCVGYNHTLFMTKSNVGLDFDSKPPTAEISVSRKEAVIAPAFEGVQTPPVMASFGTETGFSTFTSFFLGVNQTFAGGDSANIMSALYDGPTTNLADIKDDYDSTLILTQEPENNQADKSALRRYLFGLPGPGKTRPFIFGTDTSLGLKVAWAGVNGQVPDTLRAGFNRKEFAYAPLFMTNGNSGGKTTYHVKMPSFLATIDGEIKSENPKSKVGSIQYFATGSSAEYLSTQKAVRSAMIRRSDPLAAKESENIKKEEQQKAEDLAKESKKSIALQNQIATSLGKLNDPKKAQLFLWSENTYPDQAQGLAGAAPRQKPAYFQNDLLPKLNSTQLEAVLSKSKSLE